MTTPTQRGTTVGETMNAGDYTWRWNGDGWDLVQQLVVASYFRQYTGFTLSDDNRDLVTFDTT